MSTEAPAPPSTKSDKPEFAALRIFGDTMLDHFLTTNTVEAFDRKSDRVPCVDRGWFLGGTARIAANLRYLSNFIQPESWYHSPALEERVGYCVRIESLPQGPNSLSEIMERLQLRWDQVCTKIRVLNRKRLTETLKFLSVDDHSLSPHEEPKRVVLGGWAKQPLTPTRIVMFSDYDKGAITPELIDHVIRGAVPELVIYDGYNYITARNLAMNPLIPQLIIKGSYNQWVAKNYMKNQGTNIDALCDYIFESAAPTFPIILLSHEEKPLEIHTSVNGLRVKAECKPPRIAGGGQLQRSCTNGAGDLLTAGLLNMWMQLPKLDFATIFQALNNHLTIAMAHVHDLLTRRQRQDNPFLEPWHTNDADSNQALNADKVSQPPVQPGAAGGTNPPGRTSSPAVGVGAHPKDVQLPGSRP